MKRGAGVIRGRGLTLVADIGGTNARFALAAAHPDEPPRPVEPARFAVADLATFEDAVARYLDAIGAKPLRAVFAVAAPVHGETAAITNSSWRIDAAALRKRFGFTSVRLVNDFAAMSAAVGQLAAGDLRSLGPLAAPDPADGRDRVLGVIGPGTGLGVGLLLRREARTIVIETEGGHAAFAPSNEEEVALLRLLWRRFDRVSNERLISGPGLVTLYAALGELAGMPAPLTMPETIVTAAGEGSSPLARRAVELLCELLGSVAGDLALTGGAWDGIYLAGGLVQPLLPWLDRGGFRRRFEAKGRRAAEMARVPTMAVTREDAGLLGAATLASEGLALVVRRDASR